MGTIQWIDLIDDFILHYNRRKHRTIGMRAIDVNQSNVKTVLYRMRDQKYYKHIKDKPKFRVGDVVRISKLKHIFEKGYTPNFGTENFMITRVFPTVPHTYYLKDYKDNSIKGAFYEAELQKRQYPDVYLIEIVIKKRGRELYVKWLGFDESHNEWISKDDL